MLLWPWWGLKMAIYAHHTIKVPKDLYPETERLLCNNLDEIRRLIEADHVEIDRKPRSITLLIRKNESYNLNELSLFLEKILPERVEIPFWG